MRIVELVLLLTVSACDMADPVPPAREPRLLAPADPAGSVLDIAAMQGRWQVISVAIAPGPVQAFSRNDPAYVGQELIVAGTRLAWRQGRSPGGASPATIDDVCDGAATMRLPAAAAARAPAQPALLQLGVARPDPHEIACLDGGNWGGSGGGALLFPIDARTLVMGWYDNVVLKLRWQGPQ